jgi:DNA-binding CsgD family transcriptional regulator
MERIEFYSFEDQVWYVDKDGKPHRLEESSREVIRFMIQNIQDFYPDAYEDLVNEYKGCKPNLSYYQFRIVEHFCKCNFSSIDNVQDIDANSLFHFEHVQCPLRGICRHENIICHPRFQSGISKAEQRVLELLYRGCKHMEIADSLCLSLYTVKNHIKNAFARLGLHSEAEFIRYANKHNLFKKEEQ